MSMLQPISGKQRATDEPIVSFVASREGQSSLIVTIWAGESWVLPWAQILNTRLEDKRIELKFGDCLVIVIGVNLRGLLDDIAAHRLVALRELPPEYRQNLATSEIFISRIEVRPTAGTSDRESPG